MDGTNLDHTRRCSNTPLPPYLPEHVHLNVDHDDTTRGLETEYTITKMSHTASISSTRDYENHDKTDSVTQDQGLEHNASRTRVLGDSSRRISKDELTSYDFETGQARIYSMANERHKPAPVVVPSNRPGGHSEQPIIHQAYDLPIGRGLPTRPMEQKAATEFIF